MTEYDLSPHTDRLHPDVEFWNQNGTLLVTRSGEGGYVTLDEVVGETQNPRVLVQADRAVVEGQLVTVGYQEQYKTVGAFHPMAGTIERFSVDEMMDDPALLLERVPPPTTDGDDDGD